jgi:DNA-binding Lrp family transcriptional regulator
LEGEAKTLASRKSNKNNEGYEISLDAVDFKIISMLIIGSDNKEISKELNIPLSTIQRRTRNIMLSGIVTMRIEPNFKRLGIKKGLLHVYLSNGDIKDSIMQVANMDGILSASVHVGNSDIVGEFVYEDSEQLVDTISNIKHMNGVERVLWSEEVYSVPVNPDNVLSSFKKMWAKNNSSNNKYSNNKQSPKNNNGNNNFRNNNNRKRYSKKYY